MAGVVEKIYAEGLFELAKEQDMIKMIFGDFYDLNNVLISNNTLMVFFKNPRISKIQRKLLLCNLMVNKNKYLVDFLQLLIDKNRMALVASIYDNYTKLYLAYYDIQIVEVSSAKELSPKQLIALQNLYEDKLKKVVQLSTSINPALIGGLRVKINDQIYDNSLDMRVDKLYKAVIN